MEYFEGTSKKKIILIISIVFITIFGFGKFTRADDNSTKAFPIPGFNAYWYPSEAIYGFVQGCWQEMEQAQGLNELWPDEVRAVCGCIIDNIRLVVTWAEFSLEWTGTLEGNKRTLAGGYTNMCILKVLQIKQMKKEMNESGT
jgi:hypothetical protein